MHSCAHSHQHEFGVDSPALTTGIVMNWGWPYDLMVWLFDSTIFRGKLGALRERAVDLAAPREGEAVLDVGCGTGALALLAKKRVGKTGRVVGIDPGARQIARARFKAARRDLAIDFQIGVIEKLAFPDKSFDVVLSSLMMHHLPDDLKRRGVGEIARVLKPAGRLVVVDIKRPEARLPKPTRFGAGESGIEDQAPIVKEAGFVHIETGELATPRFLRLSGLGWLLARIP